MNPVLDIRNVEKSFGAVRYVSHRLHELTALCDEIAVMRDGDLVFHGSAESVTPREIAEKMVGRNLERLFPEVSPVPADAPIALEVSDHGWTGGVVYHANAVKKEIEAEHPDVRVIVSTAASSGEQVDRVENLLVQKIDALVILPSEPAPLTGICEQAVEQGVRLVVVDRNLARSVQDLLIAGDNPGFGRTAAGVIAEELDGAGKVVMMEGVQCDVNTQRVTAFRDVLAQYPGIEILESGSADWNTEKGLRLMENFLQKHPQIDAVWTGDDDVSIGALKAYEESGRDDVRVLIGGGGSKDIVKRILDGDPLVHITVTYPPAMIAVGAREAVKILKGATIEKKEIVVPAEGVTRENAAQFYHPDSAY